MMYVLYILCAYACVPVCVCVLKRVFVFVSACNCSRIFS